MVSEAYSVCRLTYRLFGRPYLPYTVAYLPGFPPSSIPRAGIVEGEILESLWSRLNLITKAIQTATLAHHAEVIDEHAANSNHKKSLVISERAPAEYDIF
jgi:hypothetical protein